MTRVRVHQHVNPLAKYYRELPINPLVPSDAYRKPELPIFLDIGCGRGRFLLKMAEIKRDYNYLGVEIREPIVVEANKIAIERGLGNLRYEFCNATIDLNELLRKLPKGILEFVTIQFPDPWFKKRHAKRRMVKDKLVEAIDLHIAETGRVLVQTDVEFLFEEISEIFLGADYKIEILKENPIGFKTEREISVEARGLPVFRMMLMRRNKESRK